MTTTSMTPRTAKVVLYQGDDEDRLLELRQEVARLKPRSGAMAYEEAEYVAAVDAHNDFLADAETRAVTVVLQPVGRKQWREMVLKHPPRDEVESDIAVGVDESTFGDTLVPASIASPTWDSEAARDQFLDSLSDAQFEDLYINAFTLNRSRLRDPKALELSAPSQSGAATST